MRTLMNLLLDEFKKDPRGVDAYDDGVPEGLKDFKAFADEYLSKNRPRLCDYRIADNYLITLSNKEEILLSPLLPTQQDKVPRNVERVGQPIGDPQPGNMDNVPTAGL